LSQWISWAEQKKSLLAMMPRSWDISKLWVPLTDRCGMAQAISWMLHVVHNGKDLVAALRPVPTPPEIMSEWESCWPWE
jgi:hypothetical protein